MAATVAPSSVPAASQQTGAARPGGTWRPAWGPEALLLLASLAFATFYNGALWHMVFPQGLLADGQQALGAGTFLAVTAAQFAGLALLLPRLLVRPVLSLLFPVTAAASFFMDRYTVFLNKEMLRNVLATDLAEARELLTPDVASHLLLFGLVPALLVWLVRLPPRPLLRALAIRLGAVAAALALVLGLALAQPREASSLLRNNRDARFLITPTNYLVSLYRLARKGVTGPPPARQALALDARRQPRLVATGQARPPVLLVLVIGESLRSASFGLAGYRRDTTPELSRLDLQVFPRVQACGTSTEVSVPCLFAPVGRRDYHEDRIRGQESLLHVLQRVGYQVLWIDNQSGCKGVCAGLPQEHLAGKGDPGLCDGERCLDEVLLSRLAAAVDQQTGDLVVVLHMLGNHGPAYARRYPPAFRRFTPDCQSRQLDDCSRAEIVNAYDNAVLYTDHVLARLVQYLAALPGRDAGMMFVSDHGESLGERDLYLHGLPWALAPAEQLEVPMLVWLSPGLAAASGTDLACLEARTRQPASHDQFFHSVLGLLGVTTVARAEPLNVFAPCPRDALALAR